MRANVEKIVRDLGIEIKGESDTHYIVLCPFHNNTFSPAATISKDSGFLYCWGAGCEARAPLLDVIAHIKGWTSMRSLRYIASNEVQDNIEEDVLAILDQKEDTFPEFDKDLLKQMQSKFDSSLKAQNYIQSRGINLSIAKLFGIGFDGYRIITPMFDLNERCIGVIGRSVEGKSFKNSPKLPSSKILFNLNRARKHPSDFCVICESSFDAIRIWQSGYASVATLGGTFSKDHQRQIGKYFDSVVLMVDSDLPGRKFADKIESLVHKVGVSVLEARYSESSIYPHGAKDASDCTDKEIMHMIENASFRSDSLV